MTGPRCCQSPGGAFQRHPLRKQPWEGGKQQLIINYYLGPEEKEVGIGCRSPSFSRMCYKNLAFPGVGRDTHGHTHRWHGCPRRHSCPAGMDGHSAVPVPLQAGAQQLETAPRPFPTALLWEYFSAGAQQYTKILHQGKRSVVDLGKENLGIRCNICALNIL